jgi:hypothetical protein
MLWQLPQPSCLVSYILFCELDPYDLMQYGSQGHSSRRRHRQWRPAITTSASCPCPRRLSLRHRLQALATVQVSRTLDGVTGTYETETSGAVRRGTAYTVRLSALRRCAGNADDGAVSTCTTWMTAGDGICTVYELYNYALKYTCFIKPTEVQML